MQNPQQIQCFMILPNRHSIRLKNYNYSSNGAYFVTICTKDRTLLFGSVGVVRAQPSIILNGNGKVVESIIESLPKHHQVDLGPYQIMPNHVHLILFLNNNREGIARNAPTEFGHIKSGSLPCIIRSFKSASTKEIRNSMENSIFDVWQRNYYEHIIRNQKDFDKICWYITNNPLLWDSDRNNPDVKKSGGI